MITFKRKHHQVVADESDVIASKYVVRKFMKTHNVSVRASQSLTEARLKALKDIRVTYRHACMIYAFSAHLPGSYKWNADATTIEVNSRGEESC